MYNSVFIGYFGYKYIDIENLFTVSTLMHNNSQVCSQRMDNFPTQILKMCSIFY